NGRRWSLLIPRTRRPGSASRRKRDRTGSISAPLIFGVNIRGQSRFLLMTARSEPDLASAWTYDTAANGIGKLAAVTSTTTGYSRTYTYDSKGRPITVTIQ